MLAFFSHFWRLWKKFRPSGNFFSAWLPQLHSKWPLERFEGKNAVLKFFCFFLPFSDRERTFLALWQNLPIWLPKLLPSCRLAHFEENLFIEQNLFVTFSWSDIDRRFFGFMAKHFSLLALFLQQDWQNCLLLVLKNSLR